MVESHNLLLFQYKLYEDNSIRRGDEKVTTDYIEEAKAVVQATNALFVKMDIRGLPKKQGKKNTEEWCDRNN